MLKEYRKHEEERRTQGIPALALDAEQVADLVELIKEPPTGEDEFILDLFTNKVPAVSYTHLTLPTILLV